MEEKELVTITEEQFKDMSPLRGTVFKEFMKLGSGETGMDMDESEIFGLFMRKELETVGVVVEDVYESLSMAQLGELMAITMELNNMEELFLALNRLNRGFSGAVTVDK